MLSLEALLNPFGFDCTKKIKLVRHQDQRYDIGLLRRTGYFEFYQSIQSRPVFDKCDVIVSFMGRPGTHAVFIGVYSVLGVDGPTTYPLPKGFIYPNMSTVGMYRYSLEQDHRFDDLDGRLVLEWGLGTRSWVQHFKPNTKSIVEVLPRGYVREFPGFLDVLLRYDELVGIIKHPASHRDWHRMLKSVAGVYLIVDTRTGSQYVGSAYGEDGLLGRWKQYAANGHGGNRQLQALVKVQPDAVSYFQFAVLQTLPVTLTAKEVIAYEVLHKQKLGTRAHGLNSN